MEIYNEKIIGLGTRIFKKRTAFLTTFIPIVKKHYHSISRSEENIDIIYQSDLHTIDFQTLLEQNLPKDRAAQFTTAGPHKEDLAFTIHGQAIKKFGSQGQQKTFLVALKLAQFDFLKSQTGGAPILLLDDAFDKLDQKRVSQIVALVDQNDFGQIFITDTHEDRTLNALENTKAGYEIFKL